MALRDIFKFRELPESETSKPFLEHLEDLRWTIVKMAITLIVAMILCFAFRGTLVRVMQAPLHEVGPSVGVLRALGHYRLDHDFVSPRLLCRDRGFVSVASLFSGRICPAGADRGRETFSLPSHLRQLRSFLHRRACLLFLALAENDSVFLPRHPVARLGSDLDGAAILFFRNPLHHWLRSGF